MVTQEDLAPLLGEESNPIEFPVGLIGLEEWRRFLLVSHPAGGALQLMQSLEDDRVSFIVSNPNSIVVDYQLSLSRSDVQAIAYAGEPGPLPQGAEGLGVYCILSVQEDPFLVTANLLGPLVINWKSGLGIQIILADSNYSPRHVVANEAASEASSPTLLEQEEA